MAVIVISGVDVNLVTDNLSTIVLFPSVLVESDDASAVLTATLTASDATNGGFTADSLLASGFTDLGDGTYTYSGTAAEMTAALQLLVFEPAADSTASGASAAIAYTIDVTDPAGGSASSSVDITIEVADGPGVPTPDQYDTVIYGDAGDNPLVGTSGNDWIEGGAGRDNIDAGAGDDYIIAGTGGDWWVKGGSGADIFQFSVGDYGVKIADWEDGVDKIFLAGGLTYADLEKLTYTGTGLTTVVYRTSNGDRLMFYNMDPTLIDEDDFLTEADFLDANTAPVAVADAPSGDEDTSISGAVTATDADGDTVTFSLASDATSGAVTVNTDGTYSYTPDANFNGADSFEVSAADGNGNSDTVTVSVTVNGVNDAPVAVDDSAASGEGASVVISLLANDSDVDGDALSLSAIGAAGNGAVVDNGDGTVTYTPTSGFSGTDSFSYTVSDGNGGTATATATVAVSAAPVNTAPVAVDDSAATDEGASVVISLLANDSDADGDSLSLSALGAVGNGTVVDNGDGTVTYTPTSGFSGTDSFSYTVSDGNGGTATATATVTVEATTTPSTGVPTPDQYDNAIYGDAGDNPLVGTSGNDWIDAGDGRDNLNAGAGDDYIIAGKGGDWWAKGGSGADIFQFSVGDYGVKIADWEDGVDKIFLAGGLTYADLTRDTYTGTGLTTVVFRTSNGDRLMFYNMDPSLIDADDFLTESDYTAEGNAPVAVADAPSGDEDTSISGAVTATDADGDTVTFSLASDATSGSVTVNTDGTYSYTPDADFNGTDSFDVLADDGKGGTDTVTVSVTVNGVNDAPVAVDDSAATGEGASVVISLLANDSDVDGDALSLSAIGAAGNGAVVDNGDGTVTYTPTSGFSGTDSFSYTVSDGNGGTATATATVTVSAAPVNTAPVAVDDSAATDEAASVVISLLANDSDADGDSLSLSAIGAAGNGTVVDNGDGTVTYTPTSGFSGTDSFSYTVSDGNGGTATATATVTVEATTTPSTGVPTPDQYDNAIYGDAGDNPLVGTSGNDWIDAGDGRDNLNAGAGDDYIIAGKGGDWWVKGGSGADIFQFSVGDYGVKIADWEDGVDKIFLAGGLTYADLTRDTYTGTGLTTVVFRTSNGDRLMFYNMDPSLIDADDFLTESDYTAEGNAPVAVADAPSGNEDTTIAGAVTATDADGDTVTFSLASDATSGSVTVNTDGTYSYTPDANFNGADSFEVSAADGNGNSDTVTVSVTVNAVNDAPVAVDDTATTDAGAAVTFSLVSNDSDVDGDSLSISSLGSVVNGTLVNNGDGTVTYTPDAGFTGVDGFDYTISDGNGGTATASATVGVDEVILPGTGKEILLVVTMGQSLSVGTTTWANREVLSTEAVYPDTVLGLDFGNSQNNSWGWRESAVDVTDYEGLTAWVENQTETHASAMLNTLTAQYEANGQEAPTLLHFNVGIPGKSILSLSAESDQIYSSMTAALAATQEGDLFIVQSGSTYSYYANSGGGTTYSYGTQSHPYAFDNFKVQLELAYNEAISQGYTVQDRIVINFIQGQSDANQTDDEYGYRFLLQNLMDNADAYADSLFGHDVETISIVSQHRGYAAKDVAFDQISYVTDNASVYFGAPEFQFEASEPASVGGDYTHLSSEGYYMMGSTIGLKLYEALEGTGDDPILMSSVDVQNGNEILVTFSGLEGSLVDDPYSAYREGVGLVPPENFGFSIANASGTYSGSLAAITSVEIVGANQVLITADQDLTDSFVLYLGRNDSEDLADDVISPGAGDGFGGTTLRDSEVDVALDPTSGRVLDDEFIYEYAPIQSFDVTVDLLV